MMHCVVDPMDKCEMDEFMTIYERLFPNVKLSPAQIEFIKSGQARTLYQQSVERRLESVACTTS